MQNYLKGFTIIAVAALSVACGRPQAKLDLLPESDFDTTMAGVDVKLYTLRAGDLVMQVTNFGGRVVTLFAPDKDGKAEDIVIGRRSIKEYAAPEGERFLGACVGPVANRIGGASFTIDGLTYNVPSNDNRVNTLHGGFYGFDNIPWEVESVTDSSILFHYLRPDGFEGYPGDLDVRMEYSLNAADEFTVKYSATTDKPTPVNISHHSFFNLRGNCRGTVEDYIISINASKYTPIDSLSIPLGENESVEGTPFDLRKPVRLGDGIKDSDNQQVIYARGYDHNWVLDRKTEGEVEPACTVWDPVSGRYMEVLTDQPGVQFYCGNFFDGTGTDVSGEQLRYRCSLALETQHFPDSPNRDNFPSVILRPGQTYTHTCVYRFSVKEQ